MTDTTATLTISVNIGSRNMWEGNAEESITIPVSMLKHLDSTKFSDDLETLITKAVAEFNKKNGE